jgi:predicted secreted hydrolase
MKDYSIDLRLSPSKPPAFHGKGGVVDMGKGGGSYYYSYTRMKVEGNITAGGAAKEVEGIAWMDHQWGSWDWRAYRGWDWFSLQLDDGTELMLFNFRDDSGGIQQESSGTIVYPDGNTERLSSGDFQVISLDQWKSTHSGATYPVDWQVAVPGQGMELRVRPVGLDRELNIEGSTYWEGPVIVEGRSGGGPVTGVGYAEMTGYARR